MQNKILTKEEITDVCKDLMSKYKSNPGLGIEHHIVSIFQSHIKNLNKKALQNLSNILNQLMASENLTRIEKDAIKPFINSNLDYLLWPAVYEGHVHVVETIFSGGVFFNTADFDDILSKAIKKKHFELVKVILLNRGRNKPSLNCVQNVLVNAVTSEQVDFVKIILSGNMNIQPSQAAVGAALITAVEAKNIDIVQFILSDEVRIRPSQAAVGAALKMAVEAENIDIVQFILRIRPSQADVGAALIKAAEVGKNDIFKMILSHKGDNKPSQEAVGAALYFALKNKHQTVIDSIKELWPESFQVIVDNALITAVRESFKQEQDNLVTSALNYFNNDGYKPSDKGVVEALIVASEANNSLLIDQLYSIFIKGKVEIDHDQEKTNLIRKISNELTILKDLLGGDKDSNTCKMFFITKELIKYGFEKNLIEEYFQKNSENIKTELKSLKENSNYTTMANIASTIGTIIFCFTGIGLIINLGWIWPENLKKRGSSFMFFDSSPKQKAEVVEHLLHEIMKKQ